MVKYVTKTDSKHKEYQPKILCSPGIGKNYTNRVDAKLNEYNDIKTNETYRTPSGTKINLPIYYRNKIYTEEEREKLWLQKLDKNERWVCGEKIDISEGNKDYYNILEWHRRKNKELGYGDDEKNWKRKIYEKHQRIINQQKRIADCTLVPPAE